MNNKLNKKVVSIDTTLRNRKEIDEALNILNDKKRITFAELENVGEKMLGLGNQAIPMIIKNFLEITDESILMRYLYLIEYLNFEEFINPLMHTVLKRNLGNAFNVNVINALYSFEVDISNPVFSKVFYDTENGFYKFDEKFFEIIQKDEDMLVSSLNWFMGLPYHKKMMVLNKLRHIDDTRKLILLEIIAHDKDNVISLYAIDILGMSGKIGAIPILRRIEAEYEGDVRSKRALRSLKKLRLLGIESTLTADLINDKTGYVCYVSMIDSNGSYVLWIVSPQSLKPPLEVLCILINEKEGIIDCFGSSSMSKKEFSSLLKKAKQEDHFIKIDYDFCKRLIKEAIYCNRTSKYDMPPEFLYRKKIFREEISPKKHVPEFEGYDLNKIKDDYKLLSKTADLIDICGINSWSILNNNMLSYIEKFIRIRKNSTPTMAELKTTKLVEDIYHTVVLPELDLIKKRLLFTADILRYDKKYKKYVKLILCAALNLSDMEDMPFNNPFLVNFILTNLKNAVDIQTSGSKSIK